MLSNQRNIVNFLRVFVVWIKKFHVNSSVDKREMADKQSYVKRPKSVDILDRMLNHTTLSTQRITHNHILGNIELAVWQRVIGIFII